MTPLLRVRWHRCPITALCFISGGMLLVGFGNTVQLYHIYPTYIVSTWHFRNAVTIHSVRAHNLQAVNKFAISVSGNRFYAGLLFDSRSSHFSLIFNNYGCDSIVHSSVKLGIGCIFFCFLSAHAEVTVIKVTLVTGHWQVTHSVSFGATPTICQSGFVVCEGTNSLAQLFSFTGSAFGRIVLRSQTVRYDTAESAQLDNLCNVSTLCCQKGLVFCVSLCHVASKQSICLASAAEDRSIAVWERLLDTCNNSPSIDHYAGPWKLLYLLNSISTDLNVQFNSRIWNVCLTECGIFATGEDCHIVWYPWLDITNSRVIEHVHRGHGVWSCDVWFGGDDREEDTLIATGGNDGAVCIHPLPSKSETLSVSLRVPDTLQSCNRVDREICRIDAAENIPHSSTSLSTNHKDFPRCLFFGPSGRLFYLTDAGHCFTASPGACSSTIAFPTPVKPQFRFVDTNLSMDSGCSLKSVHHPVSSNLTTNCAQSANYSDLFRGYIVSAVNRLHSVVAIGDRHGKVGLFLILEDPPYLVCTDLLNVGRKIMQLLWVHPSLLLIGTQTDQTLLVSVEWDISSLCLFGGTVARLHFTSASTEIWASAAHYLPPSNWLPMVTQHSVVVLGLRDGGLRSYAFSVRDAPSDGLDSTPVWSLPKCHGRGGCTSIAGVTGSSSPVVISCGRTHGDMLQWLVGSDGHLTLLGQLSIPSGITWVERFYASSSGRLFALGFQSIHFKVYALHSTTDTNSRDPRFFFDYLNGPPIFQVACGGAHRNWDFWLPESSDEAQRALPVVSPNSKSNVRSAPIMAFIKRCDVIMRSLPPPPSIRGPASKGPFYLRPGLHGKDINCCLVFSRRAIFSADHSPDDLTKDSTLLYCLAGGEDTYLSSWALRVNSVQEEDAEFFCPPEHHRGHVSSIRCLTVSRAIDAVCKAKSIGNFLITGGGRGQIGLWRLNVSDPGSRDFWRPGWLGYTLLRSTKTRNPNSPCILSDRSMRSSIGPSMSADLRVMAILCAEMPEISHQGVCLLALAACSDSSIRLLVIYPPNHAHPKSCKFVEFGSLRHLCSESDRCHSLACYLDLQWVECGIPDRLNLLATNTSGSVECWSVGHVNTESFTLDVSENWSLLAEPIAPFYVDTAPALNCVDTFAPMSSQCHFVVGGDDGSVRIGKFLISASHLSSPSWIAAETHHYATVVQLRIPKRDHPNPPDIQHLLTLAADQRLIVWSWSGTVLHPLSCSLLPGLGDPHGLATDWLLHSEFETIQRQPSSTWVLTVGTGLSLLQLVDQV